MDRPGSGRLKATAIRLCAIAGRVLPDRLVKGLVNSVTIVEVSSWLRAQGMTVERYVGTREQIFRLAANEICEMPVLYLEFGVYQGATTALWSTLLKHPDSVLHGFDSFEGLPAAWADLPRGTFAADGVVPSIDDPRVRFYKGWFDEVLPSYRPPRRARTIMILDADLYSSTVCVLQHLAGYVVSGTYLYFDEFRVDQHEFRAFREFVSATGRRFRLRAATKDLNQLLFECVA